MPLLTIIGSMKARSFLVLAALGCCAVPGYLPADTGTLPMPRVWNDDACKKFSAVEFQRQLQQLKEERAALIAEWKALVKRAGEAAPRHEHEAALEAQMKDILHRLQQSRNNAGPPLRAPAELAVGKIMDATSGARSAAKKGDDAGPALKGEGDSPGGPVDVLAQAHTLFRTRRYDEALASFRLVDLKGKKAEARAPVQYLMAICLLHLGKDEEALPLLRDVANSRGDEKLAGYAQWQLEMVRWQRDMHNRLEEQHQRRLTLEKKI